MQCHVVLDHIMMALNCTLFVESDNAMIVVILPNILSLIENLINSRELNYA